MMRKLDLDPIRAISVVRHDPHARAVIGPKELPRRIPYGDRYTTCFHPQRPGRNAVIGPKESLRFATEDTVRRPVHYMFVVTEGGLAILKQPPGAS